MREDTGKGDGVTRESANAGHGITEHYDKSRKSRVTKSRA
jgi:hypothetical protein